MRVLVTGGTGFIGAHTANALVEAGHVVRLLVRDPGRVDTNVRSLGSDVDEVVFGDITDVESVRAALNGCDAVIHAAAVVSMSRKDAERMTTTNLDGSRNVIGGALAAGLDPIIHVSSTAALSTRDAAILHPGLAPAVHSASPYTRSKALIEAYVRGLQTDGAPITVTYPGGVLGPPSGTAFGEAAAGMESILTTGVIPLRGGGLSIVDVRDVAQVHVRLMEARRGPRRYLCGGVLLSLAEVARLFTAITGRRIPVLPFPPSAFRGLGRIVDLLGHVIPLDTVFTHEAMSTLTKPMPCEDGPARDDLGVVFRDVRETLEACVAGLLASGRISAKQAGRAADNTHADRAGRPG